MRLREIGMWFTQSHTQRTQTWVGVIPQPLPLATLPRWHSLQGPYPYEVPEYSLLWVQALTIQWTSHICLMPFRKKAKKTRVLIFFHMWGIFKRIFLTSSVPGMEVCRWEAEAEGAARQPAWGRALPAVKRQEERAAWWAHEVESKSPWQCP